MSGERGAEPLFEPSFEPLLMKGNEVIAEAALRAGCRAYFGYPITPQNELIAYMAKYMRDRGGVFVQAESETAAVNMVYGASSAGARAMTSSSSPGISLKQEGISYAAGADIPLVVVNVMRAGPGLGGIAPAQSDYFQSTRGGGHGDYRCIVLAPKSVQECADLTLLAFDLSDRYRMPAILLADGLLGQMMEGVVFPRPITPEELPKRDWCVGNAAGREYRHITSIHLVPETLQAKTRSRFERYRIIEEKETRYETAAIAGGITGTGANTGAKLDVVLVAYGTSARVCMSALELAGENGLKAALFRPITLWPFPKQALADYARGAPILVVEMSEGQLVDDVKLAVLDSVYRGLKPSPVHLLAHSGGVIPSETEVFEKMKEIVGCAKQSM
ncbi:MAG: 3-methyl-2-oxobutanoate dehydrogenase subunit VorB [Spirochaetaceae bacterium]|jgi:2-oxoglutarate ferredoxin oxidoreductase subunit alpha|nr:3-methyl-2-oxobutanoate dehydrogenase subunit VorB [Spirochaetaceae bacterium]